MSLYEGLVTVIGPYERRTELRVNIQEAERGGRSTWRGTGTSDDLFAIGQLVEFKGRVGMEIPGHEDGVVVFMRAIGKTASFEGLGSAPRVV